MGEVDIQSFLREWQAAMAGIGPDQFLIILVIVILGSIVRGVLSFIFNRPTELIIFILTLFGRRLHIQSSG